MPPRLVLEFYVRKYEWCPRSVQTIVDQVGFTFETVVDVSELEIIGSNRLQRRRICNDEDLESWNEEVEDIPEDIEDEALPSHLRQKILKVYVPQRLLPVAFRPGEAPILASGKRTGAFDGDGTSDRRTVDFQLRIFDCGHFYMKQSVSNSTSSANPLWAIFEGRCTRSMRGYRLETLFRYSRTGPNSAELIVHGFTGSTTTSLNYSGNEQHVLKGFLPTCVGNDSSCWAALTSRPDKAEASRKNEEGNAEDEEDEEEEEEEDSFSAIQKQELVQSLMRELKPEQQQELRQALGEHGMKPEFYGSLSPPLRQALSRLQRRATFAARMAQHGGSQEPSWPMYLGLCLFVIIFCIFAYLWYEENYGRDSATDLDEDDYWKTDAFL